MKGKSKTSLQVICYDLFWTLCRSSLFNAGSENDTMRLSWTNSMEGCSSYIRKAKKFPFSAFQKILVEFVPQKCQFMEIWIDFVTSDDWKFNLVS